MRSRLAQYEGAVLEALHRHGRAATYVVRNCVESPSSWLDGRLVIGRGPTLTTAQVLRVLRRLERQGKVRQAPTNYAVMLCWELVP